MEYSDSNELVSGQIESAVLESLHMTSDKKKITKNDGPSQMYIFPVLKRPFFPGMAAPVMIEPGPYYEALKIISKTEQKFIGLALTKKEDANIYKVGLKDLHNVGVAARILRIIPMEQGGAQIILNMESRYEIIEEVLQKKPKAAQTKKNQKSTSPITPPIAKVRYHKDKIHQTKELKAYTISIISTIKELLKMNPLFKEELQIFLSHSDFTEPGKLADFAVALTTATREELQNVLETFDIPSRIDKALVLLKKELDLSKIQNSINQKIETTISKAQKEFYLREQLKTIKKELGIEKDDKGGDREKFENRLKERTIPEDVSKVIAEELDKLSSMETQSPEYSLARNYVDWLTVIPWGIISNDSFSLTEARKILEEDHYGLSDVKKRIIEFISVGKRSGSLKGTILCLVGPPGVGKTSIGKSIARALNRKFFRFSVGGMRDEAEIKGHRRTYIGAMPGKIIQALKSCQTMNPVIMLDEVDKIGSSYHGDPASALLEVLDPEQNSEFLDHYLDVRTDLSNILFIVTANVLDTIPEPLLDRMDILRLSGYIREEKVEIAKKYLVPKLKKQMGLSSKDCKISDQALRSLVEDYAREAGVRGLENNIKKILRQITVQLVEESENRQEEKGKTKKKKDEKIQDKQKCISITPKDLSKYLGKPLFQSDRYYQETPPGICVGLAWTSMGGATLYVETIKVPAEKTEMKLTGQAGQVMKESSEIAWTYTHGALHKYAPGMPFFDKTQVHIHFPEGATPKDGPSAGITIVTALLSLLLDTPVAKDLAMTGEITLTGKVLPIGGVKEKLVAAKRAGIKKILLPKGNLRDYDELTDEVKSDLELVFVEYYDDVFKHAFPGKSLVAF